MSRLIDADALKKDLSRYYDGEVTAKELIDEQPTIGGWISVIDGLPEKCGNYLINTKNVVTIGWYNGDKGWIATDESGYGDGYVTHWMPLPEPPKENEDD